MWPVFKDLKCLKGVTACYAVMESVMHNGVTSPQVWADRNYVMEASGNQAIDVFSTKHSRAVSAAFWPGTSPPWSTAGFAVPGAPIRWWSPSSISRPSRYRARVSTPHAMPSADARLRPLPMGPAACKMMLALASLFGPDASVVAPSLWIRAEGGASKCRLGAASADTGGSHLAATLWRPGEAAAVATWAAWVAELVFFTGFFVADGAGRHPADACN